MAIVANPWEIDAMEPVMCARLGVCLDPIYRSLEIFAAESCCTRIRLSSEDQACCPMVELPRQETERSPHDRGLVHGFVQT